MFVLIKRLMLCVVCFCVCPAGGTAKLKLRAHPEGSASGFTSVQIPVTLTLHSPAGIQYISTTASLSASPAPAPTPIITGNPSPSRRGAVQVFLRLTQTLCSRRDLWWSSSEGSDRPQRELQPSDRVKQSTFCCTVQLIAGHAPPSTRQDQKASEQQICSTAHTAAQRFDTSSVCSSLQRR